MSVLEPKARAFNRSGPVTTLSVVFALGLVLVACSNGETHSRAITGPRSAVETPPGTPTLSVQETDESPADTETSAFEQPTSAPAEEGTTSRTPSADLSPHQLSLPATASEMTAALTLAEQAVRDQTLSSDIRASWGRRQQTLYRHLANRQDWAPQVLADVNPSVRDAVGKNWEARENLAALLNTEELHSELPAWQVSAPPPPETLLEYYKRGETEWNIEWEFLAAINLIETRMGRIQGISTAGALGPMQFLPTTWAECCDGDPTNPADAIVGAAKYLTIRGGPENMDRAIWGYNNSDYYVNAVTAYANVLMADEQAYYGYHAWEIYFLSTEGLIRIPVGYEQQDPIAVTDWLVDNPETLFVDTPATDSPDPDITE